MEETNDHGSPTIVPDFEDEIGAPENLNQNGEDDIPVTRGSGKRKRTSWVWEHFEIKKQKTKSGVTATATCKLCNSVTYDACSRAGTSNFKRHLLHSCAEFKKLHIDTCSGGKEIDQKLYRELLAEAIMKHGYSFSWVEHEGNRKIHSYLNDKVQHISRNTAKKVCLELYATFKEQIKNVFKELPGRICLTSDLWSACNKRGFLCITAHYIDKEWKLHSKLLCFRRSPPPNGGFELSQQVTDVIKDWGIRDKVFSLTVDNASNMDKMIGYLKEGTFKDLHCLGEHFHIRCCAHILNLIVKNGLEVIKGSVRKVRDGIGYIDGSDGRIEKFYDTARKLNMPVASGLWMDVPTRWNSTYMMLDRALKYKEALNTYFASTDGTSGYVLDISEWAKVKKVCYLLQPFYEVTNLFSGSEYPTASLYFPYVWKIHTRLRNASICDDTIISDAAKAMLEKFDKYWHDYVKVLAFGVIFDPRYKLEFEKDTW